VALVNTDVGVTKIFTVKIKSGETTRVIHDLTDDIDLNGNTY
jgi:hypothetical protein